MQRVVFDMFEVHMLHDLFTIRKSCAGQACIIVELLHMFFLLMKFFDARCVSLQSTRSRIVFHLLLVSCVNVARGC